MNITLFQLLLIGLLSTHSNLNLIWLFEKNTLPIKNNEYKSENQYQLIANKSSLSARSVAKIAQEITVRILKEQTGGSGVIIAQSGNNYTVLTNHHVIDNNDGDRYHIITADGAKYQGRWLRNIHFGDLDLAIVQFSSNKSYRLAVWATSEAIATGNIVYASGFPNYYYPKNANYIESTYNWGMKAFVFTEGQIVMWSEKPLTNGYSLGYTNNIKDGMSGGPVLNEKGEVIAINGRLKYPLQGINAFIFKDGNRVSQQQFEQMKSLSWAIPIDSFRTIINHQDINSHR
jgi:serine protease Do